MPLFAIVCTGKLFVRCECLKSVLAEVVINPLPVVISGLRFLIKEDRLCSLSEAPSVVPNSDCDAPKSDFSAIIDGG